MTGEPVKTPTCTKCGEPVVKGWTGWTHADASLPAQRRRGRHVAVPNG